MHSAKGGVEVFANHFDMLVVHSDASKRDLLEVGVKEKSLFVTKIGSSFLEKTPTLSESRELLGFPNDKIIISTFGFFLPQKGIKELIFAIGILKQKYENILLIACCAFHTVQNEDRSKKYYDECVKIVNDLDLNDNVKFITDFLPFDSVYQYLCASNIISLAYTSSAEQSTSSAGRTALASLRPVITSDVEIFDDLKGIVPQVKARDYAKLEEKISELLEDEQKQEDLIKNTKRFLTETSWKNIARDHSILYKAFGDINFHIEGQVYSYFSASIVNRRLACALNELGVNVSLSSVGMAENPDYDLGDRSKELIENKRTFDICMRHQYPPKFSGIQADIKIIYLPVETTSVPNNIHAKNEEDNWIINVNKHVDYVWVYTTHGKNVLEKSGVEKPIYIIPCGFDENLFNSENEIKIDFQTIKDSYTKERIEIDEDTFIFMFCGHAQKRKNFDVILEAYLEEFSDEDNVLFIIKSYDGGEVHKIILDKIEHVVSLKRDRFKLPKHLYIYEDTKPELIPRYYFTADCMVQCSRAEGFGLPILEAMAMGTPSIVTPWGGPLDFITESNSFPVKFSLVHSDYHVQSQIGESFWAEVDYNDLKNTMRYVFENRQECKKKGENGKKDSKFWTSKQCAFPVIEFLREIEVK